MSALKPLPPQPVAAPPANTVFRGPNGIRAGWRVLIFFGIVAVFYVILAAVVFAVAPQRLRSAPQQLGPFDLVSNEGALFVFTAIAALIMARIEGRRFSRYGLPGSSAFRGDFWIGTIIGFSSISVCLLAIFALHGFHLNGLAIHGGTIASATAAWTGAFAVVGLAEEFSFRGYLQFTLTTGMGFWPSAILLSCLFGVAHAFNPGESIFGVASVVLFALLFCLFLLRRGNLWWAVGFHAGWDWGQTFFYGVPDSGFTPYHNLLNSSFSGPRWLTGGTVGPEASVFTPIVLIIVGFLFAQIYRENRYQAS